MDYEDFGRYLHQQRELRGMSRDEVAAATKISPALLDALESGRSERMPARVFVLNYVRAYADAIGLDPDDTVLRFEEIDRTVKSVPPPPALERARRRRAWLILAAVMGTIVLAAVVGFLALAHLPAGR